jgi:acyl carrier protein
LVTNIIALRFDLDGRPDCEELLRRIRASSLKGFAHQDAPFELVQPIFSAMCSIIAARPAAPFGATAQQPVAFNVEGTHLDILCTYHERDDGSYIADLRFRSSVFSQATADEVVAALLALAHALADDGDLWAVPVPEMAERSDDVPSERGEFRTGTSRAIPRDDTENRLCDIWAHELGVANLGIDDNFFELGGNSLIALRMLNAVADCFGCRLPLTALYSCDTVASMADEVRAHVDAR